MKKKKRGWAYALTLVVFLVLFLYWDNNSLEITRYSLTYSHLPEGFDGYRIVQISDMHGKTFGEKNSTLAERIKALKPDVLLATGDMMSSTVNDGGAFLDFLDAFGQYCPVYMCLGNHEQIARWLVDYNSSVNYKNFIHEVQQKGVILLDNQKVLLEKNGDQIALEGLTLELYHYSRRDVNPEDESMYLKKAYIDQTLGAPKEAFTLLMAHNPAYFKEYTAWGADLTLSGHVHGGIIQVPFKGGLLSPEHVFFPEYDAGLFENDEGRMIVNRGLGYSKINFRLFNRPEISFIELHKE